MSYYSIPKSWSDPKFPHLPGTFAANLFEGKNGSLDFETISRSVLNASCETYRDGYKSTQTFQILWKRMFVTLAMNCKFISLYRGRKKLWEQWLASLQDRVQISRSALHFSNQHLSEITSAIYLDGNTDEVWLSRREIHIFRLYLQNRETRLGIPEEINKGVGQGLRQGMCYDGGPLGKTYHFTQTHTDIYTP